MKIERIFSWIVCVVFLSILLEEYGFGAWVCGILGDAAAMLYMISAYLEEGDKK